MKNQTVNGTELERSKVMTNGQSKNRSQLQYPGPATNPPPTGGSSDGGGYVSENSKRLLEMVAKPLAKTIRRSSPAVFKSVPAPWTRDMIASAIENIRMKPLKTEIRDGEDIMFNYGKDENGYYLEALQPFFSVYGSVPVKFMRPHELVNIVYDLELKLIHEAAHWWKASETDAEKFGMEVLTNFERDVLYCHTKTADWLIQRGRNRIYNSAIGELSERDKQSGRGAKREPRFGYIMLAAKGDAEKLPHGFKNVSPGMFDRLIQASSGGNPELGFDDAIMCSAPCIARKTDAKSSRWLSPQILEVDAAVSDYMSLSDRMYSESPAFRLELVDTATSTTIKSAVASDGQPVTCEKIF